MYGHSQDVDTTDTPIYMYFSTDSDVSCRATQAQQSKLSDIEMRSTVSIRIHACHT